MNAIINIGSLIPFAMSLSAAIIGVKPQSTTTVELPAGIGANVDALTQAALFLTSHSGT